MPEMGDDMRLFRLDVDWEHNACLQFTHDQWGPYISGYSRAAEVLTSYAEENSGDLDILLYPIVFLSRHYLELQLKRTLLDAQALLKVPEKQHRHHDVSELWRELRPLVLRVWPTGDPAELFELDSIVAQIGELDSGSFSFRYPVDRSGLQSLPSDMKLVNVRRFSELFACGARILDGIQAGIGAYLDGQSEAGGNE